MACESVIFVGKLGKSEWSSYGSANLDVHKLGSILRYSEAAYIFYHKCIEYKKAMTEGYQPLELKDFECVLGMI